MMKRQKGLVLIVVMVIVVIFTITGMAVLSLAEQEAILGRIDTDKIKAFYLAEAGLAKMQEKLQKPVANQLDSTIEEALETGSYNVKLDTSKSPCYITSTGTTGNINKNIRVQVKFLAPPFEHAVYAMNSDDSDWDFQLRGTGSPVPYGYFPGKERGGRDMINGNIFVNGDAYFFEDSSVNPAPAPNPWELEGDVGATGDISVLDSADISGETNPNSDHPDLVDLISMDYENNNTHNVSKIFIDAGVSSGHLPTGNELRDVFVKNPSDRSGECATTSGNDYFFEPSSGFVTGGPKSGDTPIDAGKDRIYYIDGDLWIHSYPTYGFKMEGKVTIVVTGDIHICENLEYKDDDSMLGLVALGKYNESDELVSGGNIYFGDAVWGNMALFSSMMFAANDFRFNTDPITSKSAEPDSGFIINGNFAAMGEVSVDRDWYTDGDEAKPTRFDPDLGSNGHWVDAETGVPLSQTQIDTIRHYQMVVNYDARVRDSDTQPPGLPRGGSKIFAGFTNWQEM